MVSARCVAARSTAVVVSAVARPPCSSSAGAAAVASTSSAAASAAVRSINSRSVMAYAAATAAEPSTSPSSNGAPSSNPSNVGRASGADGSASSDTYAVVEIGGVQLLLEEGRWYSTDRLAASAGSTLALGRVLAVKKDGKFSVGTPYVEGAQVEAVVLEDDALGEKQVVFKFHSKKHYRRKTGHRQPLTKFMVTKIA